LTALRRPCSRERVLALLRVQGVEQLGQLRRAYLEVSGAISVIHYRTPRPGLLIIPDGRPEDRRYTTVPGYFTCIHCDNLIPAAQSPRVPCACCGEAQWCEAVLLAGTQERQGQSHSGNG
jgi:hypothetical protein